MIGIVIISLPRQENFTLKHLYEYISCQRLYARNADGINHPPTQCRKIHCFLTNRQALTRTKNRQWKIALFIHLNAQLKNKIVVQPAQVSVNLKSLISGSPGFGSSSSWPSGKTSLMEWCFYSGKNSKNLFFQILLSPFNTSCL